MYVYIPDPMWKYEPEHLGHEMLIVCGKWHPQENKENNNLSLSDFTNLFGGWSDHVETELKDMVSEDTDYGIS